MIELLRGEQMSKNTIGEKISALRKQNGLSQKELADKLCVSNKTVSKWECGNGEPDIDMLKKLSTIFSVSIDYLLDNEIDDAETVMDQVQAETIPNNAGNSKPNKKRLISIIVSAATAVIIIFLSCFLLIPRSPRIAGTSNYTLMKNTRLYTVRLTTMFPSILLTDLMFPCLIAGRYTEIPH